MRGGTPVSDTFVVRPLQRRRRGPSTVTVLVPCPHGVGAEDVTGKRYGVVPFRSRRDPRDPKTGTWDFLLSPFYVK